MDMIKLNRWDELEDRKRNLKAELEEVQKELTEVSGEIVAEWADEGITQINLRGNTLYIHRDLRAGKRDENIERPVICAALEACELGDFVEPGFNWNTLSAYCRDLDDNGEPLPEKLAAVIVVNEVFSVRKRKASSKS